MLIISYSKWDSKSNFFDMSGTADNIYEKKNLLEGSAWIAPLSLVGDAKYTMNARW